jgi:hypothetical protein
MTPLHRPLAFAPCESEGRSVPAPPGVQEAATRRLQGARRCRGHSARRTPRRRRPAARRDAISGLHCVHREGRNGGGAATVRGPGVTATPGAVRELLDASRPASFWPMDGLWLARPDMMEIFQTRAPRRCVIPLSPRDIARGAEWRWRIDRARHLSQRTAPPRQAGAFTVWANTAWSTLVPGFVNRFTPG